MFRFAILTISDKGSVGLREDTSGETIKNILQGAGYTLAHYAILPDEQDLISKELSRLCDDKVADLILTTGGTGFAKRDVTPEATLAVVEKLCPGIPEAMRSLSLAVTNRAMLSRSMAGIRKDTLIVNMPGSKKAVQECLEYILPALGHGLEIMLGKDSECAR